MEVSGGVATRSAVPLAEFARTLHLLNQYVDFGAEAWGTIVSDLAFSNHFVYHYVRDDGADIAYNRKRAILQKWHR
jgi:hypothetical protein